MFLVYIKNFIKYFKFFLKESVKLIYCYEFEIEKTLRSHNSKLKFNTNACMINNQHQFVVYKADFLKLQFDVCKEIHTKIGEALDEAYDTMVFLDYFIRINSKNPETRKNFSELQKRFERIVTLVKNFEIQYTHIYENWEINNFRIYGYQYPSDYIIYEHISQISTSLTVLKIDLQEYVEVDELNSFVVQIWNDIDMLEKLNELYKNFIQKQYSR